MGMRTLCHVVNALHALRQLQAKQDRIDTGKLMGRKFAPNEINFTQMSRQLRAKFLDELARFCKTTFPDVNPTSLLPILGCTVAPRVSLGQ